MDTGLKTSSGRIVDLARPRPEDIRIEEIAHALGNTARFGGHTTSFFSVACHSRLVAKLAAPLTSSSSTQLAALLHDGHEAYIGDLPTPLKTILRGGAHGHSPYDRLTQAWDSAICEALGIFGSDPFHHRVIRWADLAALHLEADLLLPGGREHFVPWPEADLGPLPSLPVDWEPIHEPRLAAAAFMANYRSLLCLL